MKIPGLYNGTGRTTFNFSYSGGRNGNLFDQYATVPSEAMRLGDFSASSALIIDPQTGQPFAGNLIPADRISPAAQALLKVHSESVARGRHPQPPHHRRDLVEHRSVHLRITHSITKPQVGRGGRGGGRGGAAGAGGRAGGAGAAGGGAAAQPAGRGAPATTAGQAGQASTTGQPAQGGQTAQPAATGASGQAAPAGQNAAAGRQGGAGGGRGGGRGNFQAPLNVTMNASINYRKNDGDRLNVYPDLGGTTSGSTLSVPVTINMRAGRSMHAFTATFNQTKSTTLDSFAFLQNVAGQAGIGGVATDPFDWGVPTLTFGTYTSLRDTAPSSRRDRSFQFGYTWTRPRGAHNYRMDATYQQQSNLTRSDSNANGSFTFSGLYTAGGLKTTPGSGQDFADFLLGLPQQATRQYSLTTDNISTPIEIRGRQVSLSFADDWRWKARWTINYGLQYDYVLPFTEANGHMVNLDAAPGFTAVAPVLSGRDRPYHRCFSGRAAEPRCNNVAPRVGAAWRATNRSVVRFGYGLTYNSGAYSNIARQLYQQPPFFQTGTEHRLAGRAADDGRSVRQHRGQHGDQQLRHRQELPARPDPSVERRLQPRPVPDVERGRDLLRHARP